MSKTAGGAIDAEPDELVKMLHAARENAETPPELGAAIGEILTRNRRLSKEVEDLRRERRDLLKTLKAVERGDFTSAEELRGKILAFIDYFNRTLARPFKWTFTGRPLNV